MAAKFPETSKAIQQLPDYLPTHGHNMGHLEFIGEHGNLIEGMWLLINRQYNYQSIFVQK